MGGFRDITGQKFGRLTALEARREKHKKTKWLCRCECGVEKLVYLNLLIAGYTRSCGCLQKEEASKRFKKHGLRKTELYQTWKTMRTRCTNPNRHSYKRYGGRGIKVCKEWDDYGKFYNWSMDNGYKKGLTLDRIDNNGNYTPENCRWATPVIQANNTSRNVRVSIDGVERTLAEHAKFNNINDGTIRSRYKKGIRGKELIKPVRR